MSPALLPEDTARDAAFIEIMHGKSGEERNAFLSMLKKDPKAHKLITDEYVKRWKGGENDNTDVARDGRKSQYMSLVNK